MVAGLSGITQVATGRYFSLALRFDGTVMAWGDGSAGQMGNGTTTQSRSQAAAVPALTGVRFIAGSNNSDTAFAIRVLQPVTGQPSPPPPSPAPSPSPTRGCPPPDGPNAQPTSRQPQFCTSS